MLMHEHGGGGTHGRSNGDEAGGGGKSGRALARRAHEAFECGSRRHCEVMLRKKRYARFGSAEGKWIIRLIKRGEMGELWNGWRTEMVMNGE